MTTRACAVDDDLLWNLLDGSEGAGARELREHVAACARCTERLERLERLHGGLASFWNAESRRVPEAVGPYRILRLIGEGGMGVVYEAEQPQPARSVAVKVIRPLAASDERGLRRFRREIQALSRLRHPGLVAIHDAGCDDGALYLVMELVDGEPVHRYCERHHLPPRRRLEVMAQVADAVHHAHERGVVHLDLKPSNVLVDADGTPRVLDFGLARFLHPDGHAVFSGSMCGSPEGTVPYMSPEQLAGEHQLDARSDVYALGAILYELLTGLLPYGAHHSLAEMMRAVSDTVPPAPTALVPDLPRPVGHVVMKAIATERAHRYASMRELADDLRACLRGGPVTAGPQRLRDRLRRGLRRHKAAAAAAATAAAALSVFAAVQASSEEPAPRLASTTQFDIPDFSFDDGPSFARHFDFTPDGTKVVYPAGGNLYVWHGATATSRAVIGPEADRADGWRYAVPRWCPDGRRIAMVGYQGAERRYALFVLDPESGQMPQLAEDRAYDLCWTADGEALTCVMDGGESLELRTIAVADGAIRGRPTVPAEIRYLGGYSPDGRWLVLEARGEAGTHTSDIWILPSGGGRAATRLTFAPDDDREPTFGPEGRSVWFVRSAGGRGGGATNLFKVEIDPQTGRRVGEPRQVTFDANQRHRYPKFVRGGRDLAYGVTRRLVTIWTSDGDRFEEGRALTRGRSPLLSQDGDRVFFTGDTLGRAGLFVVPRGGGTPRRLTEDIQAGGPGMFFGPAFDIAPDDQRIVYPVAESPTDRERAALCVVSTSGGTPRVIAETEAPVRPRWSPDGEWVAYTERDGLYVVPGDGGAPRRKLAQLYRWAGFVEWSPRGDFLADVGYETPSVWNDHVNAVFVVPFPGGSARRVTSKENETYKEGLVWHPSGEFLTYVSYVDDGHDTEIRFAFPDGRPTELAFNQPEHWDYAGAWAPDGRRFFFKSYGGPCDGSAHIFDLQRREVVAHGYMEMGGWPYWSARGEAAVWTKGRRTEWFEILGLHR